MLHPALLHQESESQESMRAMLLEHINGAVLDEALLSRLEHHCILLWRDLHINLLFRDHHLHLLCPRTQHSQQELPPQESVGRVNDKYERYLVRRLDQFLRGRDLLK